MLSARANSPMRLDIRIIFTFLFALTILRYNSSAYNIDSRNAKVFKHPARVPDARASYFGFSVALYTGAKESLLLVGAPRANSSELRFVKEPGTVYACRMNGVCKEWAIDKSKNGPRPRDSHIDQIKDNAWIGATIAVEDKAQAKVVVCGPRWIRSFDDDWFLNGICYGTLATSADTFTREADEYFLPQSTGNYNNDRGQTGFSIHMNSLGRDLNIVLGSPGANNGQGNVILTALQDGPLFQHTVIPRLSLREHRIYGYNYFGYAVTAGAYFNQQGIWYASSAPKSANIHGKVLVFNFPSTDFQYLLVKATLTGLQHGEYFGAALTSCDVNNDGRHELIVGAPLWAKDMDEGRVYIFTVQHNNGNFKEMRVIEGEIAGGRFGSAMVCLGDIDHDGYGDIAVGAPYEEKSGGAVYIFNGNRDGISQKYSQRLVGSQFSHTMRGFGISISEPHDFDRDHYLDIAVGAPLSDEAVLLKSTPVVTVNVTLDLKRIKLLRNMTSFVIEMRVSYEGAYVPEILRIVKILKIDQLHGRAMYREVRKDNGVYRLPDRLRKNRISQSPLKIYLAENIQNVIDPLEISASVELVDDLYAKNALCTSCIVINRLSSKTEDLVKLPFAVDCGEDNVCMSNLTVRLTIDSNPDNRYVIGSTPTITLRIDAYNRGEPAYQARVRITTEVLSLASIPPECIENSRMSSTIIDVTCDFGNPLRTNKTLMLQLDTSMVRYDIKEVQIRANISTQSDEMTPHDNSYVTIVYFDVDADIAIAGKTQENLYSYLRESEKSLGDIRFQHLYEVQRFGASPIDEVVLTVRIPTHWQHDTEDIAIVGINSTIGTMDGYQFYCSDANQTDVSVGTRAKRFTSADNAIAMESPMMANDTRANFSATEYVPMNLPSENRTLYVNCTNTAVRCAQIDCRLGPFASSLSVAKFLVTLDLQLANFPAALMKDKDIVFFVSEGSVAISQPNNIIQKDSHKPDAALVSTTFLGSPLAQRIAVWIIAVSVFLGIILLILLILGLIKIGFFNRKKKMELEALKAGTDTEHNMVVTTTSSTEVLDHD